MKSRLEQGRVHHFYDEGRFQTQQVLRMIGTAASETSVRAADVEIDRHTFMNAVVVKDWNLHVFSGATTTGAAATTAFTFTINKSLGGTGTVAPLGTAQIGTAADGSVADSTATSTTFTAGDDIVFQLESGTALPAAGVRVGADVRYAEQFEA